MEQRTLGSTGLQVSALGFGCGAVGGLMVRGEPDDQRRAVTRALDAGITYFDTAAQYGNGASEENLGRVMRELGSWQRVVVGTKVRLSLGEPGWASAAVRGSLEASLQRLGRSDVDVFHLHNPVGLVGTERGTLDLEEVLGEVGAALQEVKSAGLAHHVGFTGLGDSTAVRQVVISEPFETVQAYFNVLNPSAGFTGRAGGQQDFEGLIDTAAQAGRGVIVIRVLAAGAATGAPRARGERRRPGWRYRRFRVRRRRRPRGASGESGRCPRPREFDRAGAPLRAGQAWRLNGTGRLLDPGPPRASHSLRRAWPTLARGGRARDLTRSTGE